MARVDAVFVGADLEDNLSVRTLASAVRGSGRTSWVTGFNRADQVDAATDRILAVEPGFVGLSLAFQHRAEEFVVLAERLRARGFRGHVCAGGHVATMMPEEVLGLCPAIDTALGHEADRSVVALIDRIDRPEAWGEVPGLAWRDGRGGFRRNPPAPAVRDLDRLPRPVRDGPLRQHLGLPFAPIAAGRGCYGRCSFCAIHGFHLARPGPRIRFRSPEDVADEMEELYHERGARIFCFHDETLFLPRGEATLRRLDPLGEALRLRHVGRIAVVAKARPDGVAPGLLERLRDSIGLMRLYVGIENWSPRGLEHLGRGMTAETASAALEQLLGADVYGCYNLLVFEPDTVLEDLEENVRGAMRFPAVPFNFCRTEAYAGSRLWERLIREGRLRRHRFATDYAIADPRAQRVFEITRQAFFDRNFAADGLANLTMSLGYEHRLLRHFAPEADAARGALDADVRTFLADVHADTCRGLADAVAFAGGPCGEDAAAAADFTLALATRINGAGAALHDRLLDLRRRIAHHALDGGSVRRGAGLDRGR
jgi:radical SAM superfamily enzyme YgiQ (UPF0313 family)